MWKKRRKLLTQDESRDLPGGPVVKVRLCAYNAGDMGSIPGQGTKVPHVMYCGKINKLKKKWARCI